MAKYLKLKFLLCSLLFVLNIDLVAAGDTEGGFTTAKPSSTERSSDITIGSHRNTEGLSEEKKKNWAKQKVAFILKALSSAGTNPTDKWVPKKFSGTSTSIGYDVEIPGTEFGVSTFYTRPNPSTEIWHVALSIDTEKLETSPLATVYQDITDILGTPEYENLIVVTSEDAGQVKVADLPTNLKTVLDPFKGNKASNNTTKVINFAKGVNFFAKIKLPEDGGFKVLEQALLLGGKVDEGSLYISGSVGYDLLGKLMDDGKLEADKTAQQTAQAEVQASKSADIPPVALKLIFPSVIPTPFSLMDETQAKKKFFMQLDKTFVGIKYDKASNKLGLEAGQDVTIWMNNEDYVTKRKISFEKDKSDENDSAYVLSATGSIEDMGVELFEGFSLEKLSLAGSTKVNFKTPAPEGEETTWQTGSVSDGATRNGGIQIGGHRETTTKAETEGWTAAKPSADARRGDTTIGEHRNTSPQKKKATELKIVFGVTVNSTDLGDLNGALGLTTIKEGASKPRVKEVFMQFDGDAKVGGLNLADIKALKDIPVVNEIAINGLGLGMSESAGNPNSLDFYLYSGLTWVKPDIKGQLAIMKRSRDFYVMSRVTDFSVQKVVESFPTETKNAMQPFSDPLKAFEMPNAMLVFSTASGDSTRGGALNLSDLPTQIQTMFNGIVSSSGKVPIYGEGISIIGGIDVSKDENLKKAVDDLGISTTGPIVMGGSLGGFESGKLKAAFFLDIPKIEFPKKNADKKDNEMSKVVSVNNAGGQFFISIDAAGPTFKTGIRADVEMTLPRVAGTEAGPDIVQMGGDFYLNIDAVGVGVRFAGYTKGDWHDPLGFEDITLKETAILIGTDVSGGLELGIGTSLSFKLTSAGATPIAAADFKKVFDADEARARLEELQARMDSGQTETKDVDISAGFIIALNTTPALGIPVPKKLGFAFKNNEMSLPNTIDIFDLFLKGLMTGPAQQELLDSTPAGSPQRAVLDEIIGGFADGRWVPASQKVQLVSPVPLDVVYFKDVDIFFATPGAILPGYSALDGNIGLRLAGELWVTDLDGKNDKKVGKANIDLTLNGLDFGEIAKDLEQTYLSIASVTVDALAAEWNCPAGAFYDVGLASCWSCPKDHNRTLAPVTANNACKQVKFLHKKAKFEQDANLAWNCPKDTFYDPRNQGECWSCPAGYTRGVEAVDHAKACYKVDLSKIASYAKVTKHKKATGLLGTDCPAGQFWHFDNGYCYSCPSKHVRTATGIGSDKACMAVGSKSVTSETKATLVKPGRPEGSFLDIGKGKFYSCPTGYKRTVFAVDNAKSCEKVEVNLAKGKSEPRGQIKTKGSGKKLCFGAEDKDLSIGDNVVMQECLDEDSRFQSWFLDSLDRLRPLQQLSLEKDKAAAMCLQIENEASESGTNVKIEECILEDNLEDKNIAAQQWYVDQKDRIVSKLNSKCLNFDSKKKNLEISDCSNDNKANQFWEYGDNLVKPADIAAAENGPINLTTTGERQLCIQTDKSPKNGSKVTMGTCGDDQSQIWHWNAKGQITDNAKKLCLDIKNDADAKPVVMATCRAQKDLANIDSQRWIADAEGRIVNDQGRCMDYADGDSEGNNAALTVGQCQNSASNQLLEMMNAPKKNIVVKAKQMTKEEREAIKARQEATERDFGNLLAGVFDPDSMMHLVATKHKKGTGIFKTDCPAATKDTPKQFWDPIDGGNCWSCPTKFTRTAESVKSAKACIGKKSDAPAGTLSKYSAAITLSNNTTYLFLNDGTYAAISANSTKGVNKGYPKKMPGGWKGFPKSWNTGIEAGMPWKGDAPYLWKGEQYVALTGVKVKSGFPKDMPGGWKNFIPKTWGKDFDAALYYAPNKKHYLFKDNQYARLGDKGLDKGFPKKLSSGWKGMPPHFLEGIDAATYRDGHTYMIKGDEYIRFTGGKMDSGYPKSMSSFMTNPTYSCPDGYQRDISKKETAGDACYKPEFKAATKKAKPKICPVGQEKQLLGAWKNYCISCPKGYSRDILVDPSKKGACFKITSSKAKYKKADFSGRWDTCPSGYKKDPNGSCYTCPSGYSRNLNPVTHAKACTSKKDIFKTKKANFKGKYGSCPKGYKKDPNGQCYACPKGSTRTAKPVGDAKACVVAASSNTEKVAATKHAKAGNGQCPSGQFIHGLPGAWFGHCVSCPSGYNRNANAVDGPKACDKNLRAKALKALQ